MTIVSAPNGMQPVTTYRQKCNGSCMCALAQGWPKLGQIQKQWGFIDNLSETRATWRF